MLINISLFFLIISGLAALLFLIIRKLPILRITNPSEVSKFEQQNVRLQLIANRLKRQFIKIRQRLFNRSNNNFHNAVNSTKSILHKLNELEDFLKQALDEKNSPQRTIADYLAEAEIALKKEDYEKAEKFYLEVIKLDKRQLSAYHGLGEVYLEQRDYESAREVYEFLLRHGRAAASSIGMARAATGQGRLEEARDEYINALQLTSVVQPRLELADIFRQLGDYNQAIKYLKEALKIEPQNPKILDFYIEVSILNGQPNEARRALESLKQANPDNQKIAEFAREIRILEDKQKPQKVLRKKRSTNFGLPVGKK